MDVPKNSEDETGTLTRNRLSFSPMSARFTHRCLSVATIAANHPTDHGSRLLGGPDSQICGAAQLIYCLRWEPLTQV